jgi:hypothetical protein
MKHDVGLRLCDHCPQPLGIAGIAEIAGVPRPVPAGRPPAPEAMHLVSPLGKMRRQVATDEARGTGDE